MRIPREVITRGTVLTTVSLNLYNVPKEPSIIEIYTSIGLWPRNIIKSPDVKSARATAKILINTAFFSITSFLSAVLIIATNHLF